MLGCRLSCPLSLSLSDHSAVVLSNGFITKLLLKGMHMFDAALVCCNTFLHLAEQEDVKVIKLKVE